MKLSKTFLLLNFYETISLRQVCIIETMCIAFEGTHGIAFCTDKIHNYLTVHQKLTGIWELQTCIRLM
jgi:hypothetical protein